MRHSFGTLFFALPVVLAAPASCTETLPEVGQENVQAGSACLKISSVTMSELTRSAIVGTSFPATEDASIGIFVGGTKNAVTTREAGSDTWSDLSVVLPSEGTTLYGYYPFLANATDKTGIPVSSSVDGDDWMWATPVEDISPSRTEVSLQMNHALALVEITFNVSGYAEGAEMTALTLTGESFARTGTLDASDGTVTPETAASDGCQLLATGQSLAMENGVIVARCLLVPTGSDEREDMTIACTFDGKNLKATLSGDDGVLVKSGIKTTVSFTIRGTTMEAASVGVSGWNCNGVSGNTATVSGHSVAVSGGDIPFTLSLTGASSLRAEDCETASEYLAIRYDNTGFADGKYGVSVTCDKPGVCIVSHNADAGTITVSDVTDDINLTLAKQANWYDVTLTTEGDGTAYIGTPGTAAVRCNANESVTLTAVPGPAEDFLGWQDADGNPLGTDNPLTYSPASDITVKAVFFTTHILRGEFTVGTGRKARFSEGNLWYGGSNFYFESEQYLFSPVSSGNRTDSHISHFMWCSTASDAVDQTYESDDATVFFAASGFIVYGNSAWYTPGHVEVQSLLYNRSASTVCGVANARWFKGRINTEGSTYVNGLFLIPDVFAWPASVTVDPSANINNRDAGYSAASFSLAEFKALEQAGIVFLPAAGSRNGSADNGSAGSGSTGSPSVSNVNAEGYYWVSGRRDGMGAEQAEEVHFTDSNVYPAKSYIYINYRYIAHSVRLLIDVTE